MTQGNKKNAYDERLYALVAFQLLFIGNRSGLGRWGRKDYLNVSMQRITVVCSGAEAGWKPSHPKLRPWKLCLGAERFSRRTPSVLTSLGMSPLTEKHFLSELTDVRCVYRSRVSLSIE
jgi:hypothetical protein